MDGDELDFGTDLSALFFDSSYVEQTVTLPSGRSMAFLALKTSRTDPDLTGQILWPGCTLLMHWLDRHIAEFHGKSVIELGAGTGICSLFIAKHEQPSQILATDGSMPVIDLITQNITFHQLSSLVKSSQMKWTPDDIQRVNTFGPFDFVIGSEIAYDESCIEDLVQTVAALLGDSGRFVIGHIDRYAQTTRLLYAQLTAAGFVLIDQTPWDDLVAFQMDLIVGSVLVWSKASQ
jgi:predicted nicotinamide N-methyase